MKKYILEIVVFVCGANLMIYELVGSRLLAPYLGSGIFVWSSVIGVILGSLSFGYWLGGLLSEKNPNIKSLSIIIIFLAISVGTTTFYKDGILIFISKIFEVRLGAIFSSLILFSSSSILFGVISPYATVLKLKKTKKTGGTIGNLYAISTAGSIFGTFFAGFLLIPMIGSVNILIIITISLFLLSISTFFENKKYIIIMVLFLITIVLFCYYSKVNNSISEINEDIDTQYNRILIYDFKNRNGDIVRVLKTNPNGVQSHMLVEDSNKMLTTYGEIYDLISFFNPNFKEALLLGGGGYSYPKHFLEKFKESSLDVVEIDPGMTEVAKKYFYFKENPKIKTFHEDGRVFLNKNKKIYDAIFKDTFNGNHSIPFHLTTREMIMKEYGSLSGNGVVFVNIMGSLYGHKSLILNLEYNTYKSVFPEVFVFKVNEKSRDSDLQNFVLVATKNNKNFDFYSDDPETQKNLNKKVKINFNETGAVLKDDFAPVDYISSSIF